MMIIRVFRAKVRQGCAATFKALVQEQSIPWLRRTDGMLGCFPGEPMDEAPEEFVMVTLWRDVESLERFAGSDWRAPVVTGDEAPIVEAMTADHYVCFDVEAPGRSRDEDEPPRP